MTSAEIVKALRCGEDANGTPRTEPSDGELVCYDTLKLAAADLIERLEKEKTALLAQLKGRCDLCKNFSGSGMRKRCWATWECPQCNIECSCRGCYAGSKWEWKGLRPETTEVDL